MTDFSYGYTVQLSTKNNYLPPNQICAPFQQREDCGTTNNIRDWTYDWSKCCLGLCPGKRKCAKPDINECNIGKDKNGEDPVVSIEWYKNAPNIKCTFDNDKVNTLKQLNNYKSKFQFTPGFKENYDNMMENFCSGTSSSCPKNATSCSKLLALDNDGNTCRKWLATMPNTVSDYLKNNFCLNNPDSKDCACINRASNPVYIKASLAGKNYNPGCWYLPCTDNNVLIPSDINASKCPSEICEVIYDAAAGQDIILKDNQTFINCDFESEHPDKNIKPPFYNFKVFGISIIIILMILLLKALSKQF
ncbi:hypothetical protein AGMMS49579_26070 [Spirochaetia bacterium]|nr:hypothetical protein AGMMS49579_26070 [Spirochaetia bacterium]